MIKMYIELVLAYFYALADLFMDTGIWLIFGLVIAGAVHEFVSIKTLLDLYGKNDLRSLFFATISGLFLSICSCGVIPLAAMLREKGASTAVTLTFLLATPWGGFVHIFILSGFVGLKNALFLVAVSLAIAFISGIILSLFEKKRWIEQKFDPEHTGKKTCECHDCEIFREKEKKNEPIVKRMFVSVPKNMVEIMGDVGKFLLIGFLLAGLFKAFVPVEFIESYLGSENNILSVLIAVPVSAIIELCSEGFAVFAGQLFEMGAGLGVVLTMIMVGVSTDITELSMIWGKFGKKSTMAYLFISTFLVIIFGIGVNMIG
ncbi:hypothetical protein GF327_06475 [Candidatus Woesearchaeota archaeon]|nr:hypothetical protein [Candidatus Woesearchaeota archaeon]